MSRIDHRFPTCYRLLCLSQVIAVIQLLACKATHQDQAYSYFEPGISQGSLDRNEINEASGLEMSVRNPGMLWIHNDSGDEARLFLIDDSARWQATVHLTGIRNRDWEDIALGPGPLDSVTYVYIGDIGDNDARYPSKMIYRFEEPFLTKECHDTSILKVDTIQLIFEDGTRDAEALIVDHKTRDLYIFSKREAQIGLYKLTYPYSTSKVNITEKIMKLPYTQVVAADWSMDNKELLIKTYTSIYYWVSPQAASLTDIFQTPGTKLAYKREPQGEAIAWDLSGAGYYTISERTGLTRPALYYYKRK